MPKGVKQFIVGTLVGATLFGGTAALAANTTSLDVVLRPIKYFFDGVQKSAPAGQDGFIYKGTTYVPLRFVSESLGEEVKWDGKTSSIYVGKQPEGQVTYLSTMVPLSKEKNFFRRESEEVTTNLGESFGNSYLLIQNSRQASVTYLLNGNYNKFQAALAPDNELRGEDESKRGVMKVYGDGELIYTSPSIASNSTEIVEIDLDITGVLQLKIEWESPYGDVPYVDFIQPRFIN